jgi:DNA modification methylase
MADEATLGTADSAASTMHAKNILYYGDNFEILRDHIGTASIDLIYLDPPFNSNRDYNVIFAEQDGTLPASQIKAFEDTWHWDESAARSFEYVVEHGGQVAEAMRAFRTLVGPSDMLAYLSMMAPRLIEMQRVLTQEGSIYLHCDPTASHYLKLLMDAIFGAKNFQNEIVWGYRGGGVSKSRFGRKHDIILFYSKQQNHYFNPQYVPYSESTVAVTKRTGKRVNKTPIDLERGGHMPDWWTDFNSLQTWSPERLGYPTQKPEALLERILSASCPPDGVVLDPFCGCGTTIAVAQRLGRRWIGIDITHLAITLIRHRLRDQYGPDVEDTYTIIGEPASLEDAEVLAQEDPYQFQWWALGLVGARPTEQRKGPDKGIDGRLYFHDEADGQTKQVIISVKAGNVGVSHIRDLRGVLDREGAEIGALISLHEPTQAMRTEAADAGFYKSPGWNRSYPRIQLITVEDLLAHRATIEYPPSRSPQFRQARRTVETHETPPLWGESPASGEEE